jgi:hypothetical protein
MSFDDYANSKFISQNVRLDVVHPGDKEGHTVDVGLWTGQSIFRNGEIAITSGLETSDGHDDAFSFRGYAVSVFPDGSALCSSYTGKTRMKRGSNQYTSEGDWMFDSGTGRLAGIKGSGTFKAEGAGDKWHSECVGKATK